MKLTEFAEKYRENESITVIQWSGERGKYGISKVTLNVCGYTQAGTEFNISLTGNRTEHICKSASEMIEIFLSDPVL